jgi:uncharacterized protein (UPF0248 family)
MTFPKEVLNEIKWRPGLSLDRVEITYEHRGAPGDERIISGSEIAALDRSFFSTGRSSIPYHRIRRIVLRSAGGEPLRDWTFPR